MLRRDVTGEGKGGVVSLAPNHFEGAESLRLAPKSPNNVTNSSFKSKFTSERPHARTWGASNLFLVPGAVCPRYAPDAAVDWLAKKTPFAGSRPRAKGEWWVRATTFGWKRKAKGSVSPRNPSQLSFARGRSGKRVKISRAFVNTGVKYIVDTTKPPRTPHHGCKSARSVEEVRKVLKLCASHANTLKQK